MEARAPSLVQGAISSHVGTAEGGCPHVVGGDYCTFTVTVVMLRPNWLVAQSV